MTMLRREKEDIERLSRDRERLAKAAADTRAAELKADFEQQISAIYHFDQNETWKEAHDRVEEAVNEANKSVACICKQLGIPPQFAPGLSVQWYSRGENASRQRREELRRAAYAQIELMTKKAKTRISLKASEFRVKLVEESLTTDDAKKFLAALPTVESLMPKLSLSEVEKKLQSEGDEYRHRLLQ